MAVFLECYPLHRIKITDADINKIGTEVLSAIAGWYYTRVQKTEAHLLRRHVRVHFVHFVLYRFRLTVPVVFLDAQVLLDLAHVESRARAIKRRRWREGGIHACGQQSTINHLAMGMSV